MIDQLDKSANNVSSVRLVSPLRRVLLTCCITCYKDTVICRDEHEYKVEITYDLTYVLERYSSATVLQQYYYDNWKDGRMALLLTD